MEQVRKRIEEAKLEKKRDEVHLFLRRRYISITSKKSLLSKLKQDLAELQKEIEELTVHIAEQIGRYDSVLGCVDVDQALERIDFIQDMERKEREAQEKKDLSAIVLDKKIKISPRAKYSHVRGTTFDYSSLVLC